MTRLQKQLAEQVTALISSVDSPGHLAEAFCDLTDIEQAQFFAHVARIAESWGDGAAMAAYIAVAIEKHGSALAREFIRDLSAALEMP